MGQEAARGHPGRRRLHPGKRDPDDRVKGRRSRFSGGAAEALGRRIRNLAFAAHHGHIQPSEILGRPVTPLEYELFLQELADLVQTERTLLPTAPTFVTPSDG